MSRGYDEGNSLAMILTPTLQLCRWNYQAASSSLVPRQTVVDQNSAGVEERKLCHVRFNKKGKRVFI